MKKSHRKGVLHQEHCLHNEPGVTICTCQPLTRRIIEETACPDCGEVHPDHQRDYYNGEFLVVVCDGDGGSRRELTGEKLWMTDEPYSVLRGSLWAVPPNGKGYAVLVIPLGDSE